MLTTKQKELLVFINARLQETGVPPSFDEMKEALGLQSKSGVHRLIIALEERGFIRRLPHRARAIEVIKLPDAMTDQARPAPVGVQPERRSRAARAARPPAFAAPPPGYADSARVQRAPHGPHRRRRADQRHPGPHAGHRRAARHAGRRRALRARGQGRLDDRRRHQRGRHHHLQRCDTADNGDIVVALVEKEEATLKRLRKKGASIALEAANPNYETRIFGPDQVDIQGRLVGLIRRF